MIDCTLIHSAYDSATLFSSSCAQEAKKLLLDAGFKIFEFRDECACKEDIHEHLNEYISITQAFVNYGHGDSGTIIGYNNEILVDRNSARLLALKICYVISCSSAKELGEEVILKGGISFLGFNDVFKYSPQFEKNFKDCVNSGIRAMVEKKATMNEAAMEMKKAFSTEIEKMVVSGADIRNWLIVSLFLHNRDHIQLLGDGSASLWDNRNNSATKQSNA